jgi:exonuclease III
MQSIRLATYNVNGLNNPVKRGKILSKLKKDKVQIAYLQETHLNATEHAKLNRMGIKHVFSSSDKSGHKRGVAILLLELYPNSRDYTYYSSPHAVYTRIDYFFTFSRDLHKIERCDIGPITLSDHSPVFIALSLNREQRSTLWRLNSNILNNPDTKEFLSAEINTFFELNLHQYWHIELTRFYLI